VQDATVPRDWWSTFGDPALTRVIEDALAHNDDIAAAAERVSEARAQFQLAEARRLPDVEGAAQGGHERDVNPGFGIPEAQSLGAVTFEASWDLDLFGRLRYLSQAARAGMMADEAAHDAVHLAVASAAAQGYINLRALDARLEVAQSTLDARDVALRLVTRRVQAGYSAQLDLHQAEAEYHAAQELIPETQLAIRRQEDGLSFLLGRSPGGIERGRTLQLLLPPAVPAGLPASLLRRRPDVVAAEAQLVAADRSLDAARAAFMPDIALSGQGGAVAAELIAQNPTGVYTIEAAILGPIFDAGRLRAQQDAAAARRNQAAYTYRRAALSAFRDVEDALATMQRSTEREHALAQERDAQAATLHQATGRYRSGYSPYLEQIDAERALLASELELIQSHADRLDAAVSLYEALGGGWGIPCPARPASATSGTAPASNRLTSACSGQGE
jgi:NodT family efflux transporter outer membrane factor (OMF) lipoprotein